MKTGPALHILLFSMAVMLCSCGSAPAATDGNKIKNGDFAAGKRGWQVQTFSGARATYSAKTGKFHLIISNGGPEPYSLVLSQGHLKIEKGKTYQIKFTAYSEPGGKQIYFKVSKATDPWTAYSGYKMIQLGDEPKIYTIEFEMKDATNRSANIEFHCGTDDKDVHIDNVALKEKNPNSDTAAAAAPLVADLSLASGSKPFRVCGYGIHLGLTPGGPSDELVSPLKPSLLRYGNLSMYKRSRELGSGYMLMLYGEFPEIYKNRNFGSGVPDPDGYWPGDNGNWEPWDKYVTAIASDAVSRGYSDIIWEVWNEPDINYFWKRSYRQFLETYAHTVKLLKSVIPNAIVTGPGNAVFIKERISDFFSYAKKNDVLPDIINWHETSLAPVGISERAGWLRNFLEKNGIDEVPFFIPEFTHQDYQFSPGNAVILIGQMHNAGIAASAKSCWPDPSLVNGQGNCFNNSIDGLLDPAGTPRSIWWAYKKYADMSGTFLPVKIRSGDGLTDGIAAFDAASSKVFILLGRSQSPNTLDSRPLATDSNTIKINITDIPESLCPNGELKLKIERIPNSGPRPLKNPMVISESAVNTQNGIMSIELKEIRSEDAWFITLSGI